MGRIDLENFPTSSSALRMLDDVSTGFYENSYVGKWLYQVMGLEYDDAFRLAEALPDQFFPETATWGLRYHEEKWGLLVRESLDYEERRKLIYQKRDYRAPMTPYRMETYLRNATGFETHISDCHDPGGDGYQPMHPNIFRVVFEGEGTLDVRKAKELIKKIKQSHTTFSIFDKVADIMDNRELEKIFLVKLRLHWFIPFWDCYVFDGTWNLDGSVQLCQQRRYDLRVELKYYEGIFYELAALHTKLFDGTWNLDGSISLDAEYQSFGLRIYGKIENENKAGSFCAREILGFIFDFWNLIYFDGKWKLDGKKYLNASRCHMKAKVKTHIAVNSQTEEIRNEPVEIRRNLWFLDGTLDMSGARILNAMQRKEVL